ncbi:MAG: phosphotransferase [Kyrpidia sp.]|nr:phosphotransferase [Kyrpidia sp.]
MAESIPPWLKHLWKEFTSPPAFLAKTKEAGTKAKTSTQSKHGKKRPAWAKPASPVVAVEPNSPWEDEDESGDRPPVHVRPKTHSHPSHSHADHQTTGKPKKSSGAVPAGPEAPAARPRPSALPTVKPSGSTALSALGVRDDLERWGFDSGVLSAYPYVFTRASRHGQAIRLESARTTVVVKRSSYGPLHLEAIHNVLEHVFRRGGPVPRWIPPRHAGSARSSNAPFVRGEDGLYYAMEWVDGRAVDLASVADMAKSCESLSRFHQLTRRWVVDENTGEERHNLPYAFDMVERLARRTEEMEKVLQRSESEREDREADLFYLEHAPTFIRQAHEALDRLLAPECGRRLEQERESPAVCHMDLTPNNLLRNGPVVYLIDFDYLAYAPRTLDLAHLLRRGLQKAGWAPELGLTGVLHYNTAVTLTRVEYQLLRAFLTFPHRFWRAARRWQQGDRSGDQSLREFRRCVREEPARKKFLEWFHRHALS